MNKNKPFFKRMLLLSSLALLITLAITVWAWEKIPAGSQIPTHWNIRGEVDAYGSKETALLAAPGILVLLTILLTFLPRIESRWNNLQQSFKAYGIVWGLLITLFVILHVITVWAALGYTLNINVIMAYVMGVLFMVIGNYLGKIRSNFMFGIRTPWTLSSELAWNKTHRLGGRLFFLTGLLVFVSGFVGNGALTMWILLAGILVSLVLLFGYSYAVWKWDNTARR
jgi:uncharacterized membrane protein